MSNWPKTVIIRGLSVTVESWEELDELIDRYGTDVSIVVGQTEKPAARTRQTKLTPADHALLQQFVGAATRGITTKELSVALGKKGKAIRPTLEAWSRRIGLVAEEEVSAFKPIQRTEGRGFRLTDFYLRAAREMLGT